MLLSGIFKGVLIINLLQITIVSTKAAHKYGVLIRDEEIFSPCDNPDAYFLDRYVDLTKVNFETLSNGSIYVNGPFVIVKDLGTQDNPATIQVFKKSRNNWVSTVFNLNRNDGCTALFDRSEMWHDIVDNISEEDRRCPLKKDTKIGVDVIADMTIELPDPRLAGEYRVEIIVNLADINEVFCTYIFAELYRY